MFSWCEWIEKKGRKLYKRSPCLLCGCDRGYQRLDAEQTTSCQRCAKQKIADEKTAKSIAHSPGADPNDIVVVIRTNGIKKTKVRKYCIKCGADRGYRSIGDKLPLCKKCANSKLDKRRKLSCHRLGISESEWSTFDPKGSNSRRQDPNYLNAIKLCYKLANYTCVHCSAVGSRNKIKLNAHHLISYSVDPSLSTDINNLVCLCQSCHIAFHKKYGSKTTPEQFQEFNQLSK